MPSPAAIAILHFGKLIHAEATLKPGESDPRRVETAEARLIEELTADRSNTLLKPALIYHVGKPIEPIVLRILALVAYLQLATNYATAISDVAVAVAGDDEPAKVIEARQAVTRLLYCKRLLLRNNSDDQLELGQAVLTLMTGGGNAMPATINACDLYRQWRKFDADAAKRRAKEQVIAVPSAKELAARIAQHVIGLDAEVRTFACRLALHQRRAAMLRAGTDPGTPNEVLLFIGPSGCGKTWLAETAGRVCGLPFSAVSSTDMTADGYQGLNVDDALKQLLESVNHDTERARYGLTFFDEWDKKRISGAEYGSRDVAGASVQQGVLRMIEGCDVLVGGRRGGFEIPCPLNTRGLCFVFAGAFGGLDQLLGRRGAHGIGFGDSTQSERHYLHDALVEFGMIPEFVNRLTGILSFPAPTIEQLEQVAIRAVIPGYARLLAAGGADLQVSTEAVHLIAEAALATGTYARGIKSVVARLVEDIVFEERKGVIALGADEVDRAIEAAGLAAPTE
jgi:ATP-dependent Clp protease ATP-binding subunit ClpX